MQVHQLFLHNRIRNFNYLVEFDAEVFCIDPFDVELISKQIATIGKPLKAIINTHEHWDHIDGNAAMKSRYGVELWTHKNAKGVIPGVDRYFEESEVYQNGNESIQIMATPGHTMAHCCLFLQEDDQLTGVITGDTVFMAGVGNCHNGGDPAILYETISNIFKNLPNKVKLYPSHDYAQNNLRFSLSIEDKNKDALDLLQRFDKGELDSTQFVSDIELEKKVNCFFRYDQASVKDGLGMNGKSDKEIFLQLREKRNHW